MTDLDYKNWTIPWDHYHISGDTLHWRPEANAIIVSPVIPAGDYLVSFAYTGPSTPPSGVRLGTKILPKFKSGGGSDFSYAIAKGPMPCLLRVNFATPFKLTLSRPARTPARQEMSTGPIRLQKWDDDLGVSPKTAYASKKVSISAGGLMKVDGNPFVPIGIQLNQRRKDYRGLKHVGFNLDMWAASVPHAERATKAGMYYMLNVTPYLYEKSKWGYNNPGLMLKTYGKIMRSTLAENCIGYYVDNEAYAGFTVIHRIIEAVRNSLPELPIYALQGNYGLAPLWSVRNWMDYTGTYLRAENSGGASPGAGGLTILANHQLQSKPVTFMQINNARSLPFDQMLEAAKHGLATGFSHWGDGQSVDVLETDWIDDLRDFKDEFFDTVMKRQMQQPPPVPVIDEEPPAKPPKDDKRSWSDTLENMPDSVRSVYLDSLGDWDIIARRDL